MPENEENKIDYKDTLNLPKTDFPMKASLPKTEPERIKKWEEKGLYNTILEKSKTRVAFTLHDGPPYANGHIHIGHALNKILKDVIIKSKFMSGYGVSYIPGWDCHGLPIELQVEKNFDKQGKKKEDLTKTEIRQACRVYANEFVNIQKEEFKRLGILGRFEEPYLTMNYPYQAKVLEELGNFNKKGLIYKDKKPVHWCPSCETALAEAEVEHADKTSPSVFVKFKIKDDKGLLKDKENSYIVIWTTTPWTLPSNMALATGENLIYVEAKTPSGDILIFAKDLLGSLKEKFETDFEIINEHKGSALKGMVAIHPIYDRESKIFNADFVTTEAGSGCVHIAPGHGQDDYELGLREGLEIYAPVDNKGHYTKEVEIFEGVFVFKANKQVIAVLEEKNALLKKEDITHSYPHCWRCKGAVIFRATEQWFVSMKENNLRETALKAIKEDVSWIPEWGQDRIYAMIEARPDWCLSRQRTWGVPIPGLYCGDCNHTFLDNDLISHLVEEFKTKGADIWFDKDLKDLLPEDVKCPKCGDKDNLKKEENILDVWFDSGVSFAAVMEQEETLKDRADLYLEGSDQHRGWFHSSLLASVATRGRAPYDSVLTHGFVMDKQGKKMSKSRGNVVSPDEVIKEYGAEILRLWVASEDYRDDMRISKEILKRLSESYRRIRNTFRYILGNLSDFDIKENEVNYEELTELDKVILHRLNEVTKSVLSAYEEYEFHKIYHIVNNFCSVDLSSFYLDIIKDRLYTRGADSKERRAAQTACFYIFDNLAKLLAPILCFTSEEALSYTSEKSAHLQSFPAPQDKWNNPELNEKWETLGKIKNELSKEIETKRAKKEIGHSLDCKVTFHVEQMPVNLKESVNELKDMLIISDLEYNESTEGTVYETADLGKITVSVEKAPGEKCERCWKYATSVGTHETNPTICTPCKDAL